MKVVRDWGKPMTTRKRSLPWEALLSAEISATATVMLLDGKQGVSRGHSTRYGTVIGEGLNQISQV